MDYQRREDEGKIYGGWLMEDEKVRGNDTRRGRKERIGKERVEYSRRHLFRGGKPQCAGIFPMYLNQDGERQV